MGIDGTKRLGLNPITVAAIAIVAYAITNVAHEGLGHGGACLLVGSRPQMLNAIYFQCDDSGQTSGALRAIAAGGTIVNLLLAAVVWRLMPLVRRASDGTRFFAWLLLTLNLLQSFGYLLFSGLGKIGDWAAVCNGLLPSAIWRPGLALLGSAGYWWTASAMARRLNAFVGADDARMRRARLLTLLPYLAGGSLYCAAGLLNPESMTLVLVSAAAASFGGASALAWMASLLRGMTPGGEPLRLPRLRGWQLAGLLTAGLFIGWLGRGIRL